MVAAARPRRAAATGTPGLNRHAAIIRAGHVAPSHRPARLMPSLSSVQDSVLDLIGDTPMVRASDLDTGPCELYLKLECMNPGGSIKDRIGMYMIEAAEKAGRIKPGDTLVEGTAGNTGIGLALVAQQKGYSLVLVVPDKMSREKIFNLRAMGAEVVLTRSDVAKGHPQYYQDMAERMAQEMPDAYFINQFGNPDNPKAHETAPVRKSGARWTATWTRSCSAAAPRHMTGLSRYFAKGRARTSSWCSPTRSARS
jgi:cystathionine beta-synthase